MVRPRTKKIKNIDRISLNYDNVGKKERGLSNSVNIWAIVQEES